MNETDDEVKRVIGLEKVTNEATTKSLVAWMEVGEVNVKMK